MSFKHDNELDTLWDVIHPGSTENTSQNLMGLCSGNTASSR